MKKFFGISAAFCLALMLGAAPVKALAEPTEPTAVMLPESSEINVVAQGGNLRVTGAVKQTLTIYYLTGAKAAAYSIESNDQTINTSLQKGIYLVKVGKFVRKVSIS